MKVLVLVPSYNSGGAEILAADFIDFCIKKKYPYELIILNAQGSYKSRFAEYKNKREYYFKRLWQQSLQLRFVIKGMKEFTVVSFLRSTSLSMILSTKSVERIVCIEANTLDNIQKLSGLKRMFYLQALKYCYSRPNVKLIYNSGKTKESLSFLTDKGITIPNPIRQAPIQSKMSRTDFLTKRLGAVGRLTKQKNFHFLLDLLSILDSHYELIIYGEGEDKEELESYARSLRLDKRIKFKGFQKNIVEVYGSIDVLLVPSLWEGFGNVVLEGLSHEVPVIASENVGAMEFIEQDFCVSLNLELDIWKNKIEEWTRIKPIIPRDFLKELYVNFGQEKIFAKYLEH
jgi:glycosyltransferase involved in cell wall biosynthesis